MTEKRDNNVGEKIRQAIKEAGLTQQKLADKLGITNPVVNVWVTGKRKNIVSIKISPRFAGIFLATFKFFSHGKLFFLAFVPTLHRSQITYHAAINLAGRDVARVLFGF